MITIEGKSSNYTVLIEQDEDGIYIAKVLDIPRVLRPGKNIIQIEGCVKEAIQVCLEAEQDLM